MKRFIFGAALLFAFAPAAFAVFGVGDVVIVASNPAQELLWAAKELPKWMEMIETAQKQVGKTQEMIDLVGHPEQFMDGVLSSSKRGMALVEKANQLATRRDLAEHAREHWSFEAPGLGFDHAELTVSGTYRALGQVTARKRAAYVPMATEKALHARLQQASENKHAVDKEEMAVQQRAIEKLRAAATQGEIAAHQAAVAASRQRMEIASARVVQARAEIEAFQGDVRVEREKKQAMTEEWAKSVFKQSKAVLEKTKKVGGRPTTVQLPPEEWNLSTF